jgi:hypothetical protein
LSQLPATALTLSKFGVAYYEEVDIRELVHLVARI